MAEAISSGQKSFLYDAFISYSRKDRAFVAVFEAALRRYKPPKALLAPQRRLNVFRDTEDFTGTEYKASVAKHLQASHKLIVICSPNARSSEFVDDEVRRFAQTHQAADIIPVLIAGVPNNETKSDVDPEMAFPAALVELLEMPLACDYRGFDPKRDKDASGKKFQQEWFKLLANIYDRPRAEVEQRELRRQRQQRIRLATAAISIVIVLALAFAVAQDQRRTAKSKELAAQSMQQAERDPEQALRLASNAVEQRATKLSTSALRLALAKAPDLLIPLSLRAPTDDPQLFEPPALDFAPDGTRLAVADKSLRVVDLQTGRIVLNLDDEGKPIAELRYSPDGAWLAAFLGEKYEKHNTIVFDAASGKALSKFDGELHWLRPSKGAQEAVVLYDKHLEIGALDNSGSWRALKKLTPRDFSRSTQADEDLTHELSPDGRKIATLVTGNNVSRLTLTDLESGESASRALPSPMPNKLVWSPKGSYIVAASLFGFHVVEARSLKSVFHRDTGNRITVEDVAFSPNEKLLATTDRGGNIILWDIAKNKMFGSFSGPPERVYEPIFSPDGEFISGRYVTTDRVLLFAVEDPVGAEGAEILEGPSVEFSPLWGGANTAAFTRDGSALAIAYEQNKLAFWKTERWRWRRRLPLEYDAPYKEDPEGSEGLKDVRVTPDALAVGVLRGDKWRGWSVVTGDEVSEKANALKPLSDMALSEFGDLRLRANNRYDTTVYVENHDDGSLKHPLQHSAEIMSKTFSPDGSCILTTSRFFMASGSAPENADVARLWDTETGALLREWRFHYHNPHGAFFAAPDRIVVLAQGEALVYETPLCEPLDSLRGQAQMRIPSP